MKRKMPTALRLVLVLAMVASLGIFALPASALAAPVVALTDSRAGVNSQYTVSSTTVAVTGALAIGTGTITVTFPAGTTVPTTIMAGSVSVTSGGATAGLTINPVVSGRAVTMTTPVAIGAAAAFTVIFAPSVGIINPPTPAPATYIITIQTSSEPAPVPSATYAIAGWTRFSPATAARGATITVTGGGFSPGTTGTITLSAVACVGPFTATGGSAVVDASGNFSGTFTTGSGTAAGGIVNITDGSATCVGSATAYAQNASATPRTTSATPGSTVSVDLLDFTGGSNIPAGSTTVAGVIAANSPVAAYALSASGGSASLTPYKFVVPLGLTPGIVNVVVTDFAVPAKTATFQITIANRVLTVTPTSAAPGSSISIGGAGFTAGATIAIGALTMTGGTPLNTAAINIDTSGNFLFVGAVPTADASVASTGSKTFTATDTGGLVGTSSGFTLPTRTITIPATAVPGQAVTASGTGMTVATGDVVTVGNSINAVTNVFPVNANGTWSGSVVVPATAGPGTIVWTATDNALGLAVSATNKAATNNMAVAAGVITVTPGSGPTGSSITIAGSNFPVSQTLTVLTVGGGNGLPAPAPVTSSTGTFSVTTVVPAAALGGSLPPGAVVVTATAGAITGSTAFTIPTPVISVSPSTVSVGSSLTVTGSNFSAINSIAVLNIGAAPALPAPAPVTDSKGSFTATTLVPALNPGTYTVTVTNGAGVFTANATVTVVAAVPVPVTVDSALASLTTANALNVAYSPDPANPGKFLSFIPGQPGNTLSSVQSFQTVIINVTVAGQAIPAGFRGQPGQTSLAVGVNFLTYAP